VPKIGDASDARRLSGWFGSQIVAVAAKYSIGMGRRAGIVRLVVNGGDAGIGRLYQPQHHAIIEIVSTI
jgi:hypothetical protein